jgi:hypothetical protein
MTDIACGDVGCPCRQAYAAEIEIANELTRLNREIEWMRAVLALGVAFMREQTDENAAAFEKALGLSDD